MIPFYKWIENKSLSPAQHRVGEQDKNIDEVVGKRLAELAIEMETEGIASRQDVVKSIERIIASVSKQTQPQQPQQSQDMSGMPQDMSGMPQDMSGMPQDMSGMPQSQKPHPLA